ncbi:hypothetical protein R3P38DRAFT_3182239 [Favolaschia claudopus]|uniref:Uncharacterized protein n=1 Tax=Favolaschia claudopus TaxID=2862362 RepID=A0AAW0CEL9_9AGAR
MARLKTKADTPLPSSKYVCFGPKRNPNPARIKPGKASFIILYFSSLQPVYYSMPATWYPEGYAPQQQYYYPPGPPPLSAATSNPNPPRWQGYHHAQAMRLKNNADSGKTSSRSQSSGQVATVPMPLARSAASRAVSGSSKSHKHKPADELVDGVDYFKIGDMVRIRRWTQQTDCYTDWKIGQIVRPILSEHEDETVPKRSYICSYEHGPDNVRKEKIFSPALKEIASVQAQPMPPHVGYKPGATMFAPIPFAKAPGYPGNLNGVVYSTVTLLTAPNEQGNVAVRVLAGPGAKREINNIAVEHIWPYHADSAQMLRRNGAKVIDALG